MDDVGTLVFKTRILQRMSKLSSNGKYHAKDREGVGIERGPNFKMTGWNTPSCGGPLCNEDEKG